jgi:hypothetical protein
MQSLGSLAIFFSAAFAVAAAVGLISYRLSSRSRSLAPGAVLKIRAASGVYRSRLIAATGGGWHISAPLQRDSYVPLRVGEELVIESPCADGILLFRTEVVSRDSETHQLSILPAHNMYRIDRRELRRWPHLTGETVKVEGEEGRVLDISEGGARIELPALLHRGERVRIEMPWSDCLFAWVLSCDGAVTRLRFEDLMELRA